MKMKNFHFKYQKYNLRVGLKNIISTNDFLLVTSVIQFEVIEVIHHRYLFIVVSFLATKKTNANEVERKDKKAPSGILLFARFYVFETIT